MPARELYPGGIPTEAHDYSVNGRMPSEWVIDRLHVRMDSESGIVNDSYTKSWSWMMLDTLMAATCLPWEAAVQARSDQDQRARRRCP